MSARADTEVIAELPVIQIVLRLPGGTCVSGNLVLAVTLLCQLPLASLLLLPAQIIIWHLRRWSLVKQRLRGARQREGGFGLGAVMNAAQGRELLVVETLNADGEPVDAGFPVTAVIGCIGAAGIRFHRDFDRRCEIEQ